VGQEQFKFLFQAEAEVLSKLFTNPLSVIHPFTLLPLFGQLALLVTLFQQKPGKWITFMGMGCIGVLLLLMFVIGLLDFNFKILISTLPFLAVCGLVIRSFGSCR